MLSERGDIKKAARLLEAAWKQVSHPDIASAYLDVRPGDSARDRFARAETLTKLRPADPEGVLALAGAAIHAQDFARARATLKPLLAGGASVRACLLMAELEEAEHGATGRVREWLARATRAPRDAAWVADGLVSDQWLPVSPISGRLDAFVWTVPPATLGSQGAHLGDDVLADLDEPSAPLLEGKAEVAEAVTVPAAAGLAPPAAPQQPKSELKPEPSAAMAPPPAEPVVEITPTSQQAKPAPVVFPVPHAPDDPGPEQQAPGETKGRFRIFS
jgi:HemY protein